MNKKKVLTKAIASAAAVTLLGSAAATSIAVANADTIYTVQKGDYLCKIAENVYGDARKYDTIAKANPDIKDINLIYIGQRLVIPGLDSLPNNIASSQTSANNQASSSTTKPSTSSQNVSSNQTSSSSQQVASTTNEQANTSSQVSSNQSASSQQTSVSSSTSATSSQVSSSSQTNVSSENTQSETTSSATNANEENKNSAFVPKSNITSADLVNKIYEGTFIFVEDKPLSQFDYQNFLNVKTKETVIDNPTLTFDSKNQVEININGDKLKQDYKIENNFIKIADKNLKIDIDAVLDKDTNTIFMSYENNGKTIVSAYEETKALNKEAVESSIKGQYVPIVLVKDGVVKSFSDSNIKNRPVFEFNDNKLTTTLQNGTKLEESYEVLDNSDIKISLNADSYMPVDTLNLDANHNLLVSKIIKSNQDSFNKFYFAKSQNVDDIFVVARDLVNNYVQKDVFVSDDVTSTKVFDKLKEYNLIENRAASMPLSSIEFSLADRCTFVKVDNDGRKIRVDGTYKILNMGEYARIEIYENGKKASYDLTYDKRTKTLLETIKSNDGNLIASFSTQN